MVSVVIPVFHDSDALASTLGSCDFAGAEVIVVATDEDRAPLARLRAAYPGIVWIEAPRGRARQMNAGAAAVHGQWIVFLHADTTLASRWRDAIAAADADPRVRIGCFRFALDSSSICARVIECGVRVRVALFALPYGDQALFVRRAEFAAAGGFADLPIMEDVDLVRRFTRAGRLFRAPQAAVTSARKWEKDGWISRTAKHLRAIALYYAGVAPERLAASL
jgi:rSAM/selenodomain-associated transferase 2